MSLNALKCLVTLQWLTGEDGRVSFSKLVGVALLWMLGVLLWHLVDSPSLVDSLWPLVALFSLSYAGSFGLKGLQVYFAATKFNVSGRSEISRRVVERRDPEEGIDPA